MVWTSRSPWLDVSEHAALPQALLEFSSATHTTQPQIVMSKHHAVRVLSSFTRLRLRLTHKVSGLVAVSRYVNPPMHYIVDVPQSGSLLADGMRFLTGPVK